MSVSMFRKAIIALAAALGVLGAALADGSVDASEGVAVALAFLTAFGIYRVPNSGPVEAE